MKYFLNTTVLILIIILITSCSEGSISEPIDSNPNELINGKVNLLDGIESQNIVVNSIINEVTIESDGNFEVIPNNTIMAINKNIDKLLYIGYFPLNNFYRNNEILLNAKETAIYLMLNSIPFSNNQIFEDENILTSIKENIYALETVKELEIAIQENIITFGYFNHDLVKDKVEAAINELNQNLEFIFTTPTTDFNPIAAQGEITPPIEPLTPFFPVSRGKGLRIDINNTEFNSEIPKWTLECTAYNSYPVIMGVTVGRLDPQTQIVSYSDNDFSNLLSPYNVSAFYDGFSTIEGVKNYFSDFVALINNGWSHFAGDNTIFDKTKNEGLRFEIKDENDVVVIYGPKKSIEISIINLIHIFSDGLDFINSGIDAAYFKNTELSNPCDIKKKDLFLEYMSILTTNISLTQKIGTLRNDFTLENFKNTTKELLAITITLILNDELSTLGDMFECQAQKKGIDLIVNKSFENFKNGTLKKLELYETLVTAGGNILMAANSWGRINDVYFEIEADFNTSNNDPPVIEWEKSFGGSSFDNTESIQKTNDGGFIIGGFTSSEDGDITENKGGEDYWIIKLNDSGNLEWQKTFGGSNSDFTKSIQQTDDGGFIVAGHTFSNNGDVTENKGIDDYWIIKLSNTGNLEWQKSYGGSDRDCARSIQQTDDGGFIVAGHSESINGDITENKGNEDYWIIKLNDSGNLEWQKSYGGSGSDKAESIQQTFDGGFIVAGYATSNDGDITENKGEQDYWILKLNAAGNLEWEKSFGGSNIDEAESIYQTIDGGFIVAGNTISIDGDITEAKGGQDYWILKLDAAGNLEWEKSFGGSFTDDVKSIQQTTDEGYIVAGHTTSIDGDVTEDKGGQDYWILKLNASGSLKWQKSLGGSGFEFAYSIRETLDNNYIIAGNTFSNDGNVTENNGTLDIWIVKLMEN